MVSNKTTTVVNLCFLSFLISCGSADNTFIPIPGPKGDNGNSCSIVQNPNGATVNCTDGTSITLTNGPQGPMGAQGPIGQTGSTGTSVIATKFCADDSSSYPEFGLAFGTTVYGVYWDGHEAFLALLIPGHYMSTNGTGCQFTVNPDGSVSQ